MLHDTVWLAKNQEEVLIYWPSLAQLCTGPVPGIAVAALSAEFRHGRANGVLAFRAFCILVIIINTWKIRSKYRNVGISVELMITSVFSLVFSFKF